MRVVASIVACTLAATVLSSKASTAATPALSGPYVMTMTILCQAGVRVIRDSDGDVINLNRTHEARLETDVATATFNNTTRKVSISGFAVFGQTLQIQGLSGGVMAEVPMSFTQNYANTDLSLTLGSEVYRVVYGKVASGIAQHAAFQRRSTTPNNLCAMQGTISRK